MKSLLMIMATSVLVGGVATAADPSHVTTSRGKRYDKVKVLKVDPDGVAFSHSRGIAKVCFKELPQDWRSRHGYEPKAARAFVASHFEAERLAAARRLERNRLAADKRRGRAAALAWAGSHHQDLYGSGYGWPQYPYADRWLPPLGHSVGYHGRKRHHGSPYYPRYISNTYNRTGTPSFLMFGGYRYPTPAAYGYRGHQHCAPAVSNGYRGGGTGGLIQVRGGSILHR